MGAWRTGALVPGVGREAANDCEPIPSAEPRRTGRQRRPGWWQRQRVTLVFEQHGALERNLARELVIMRQDRRMRTRPRRRPCELLITALHRPPRREQQRSDARRGNVHRRHVQMPSLGRRPNGSIIESA